MKIIIGLGNPGAKYEFTRHNAGFLMVDFYASENGFSIKKAKHRALTAETVINGEKILFVKPQTFMNLSGESVREIINFYKADISDILVIYDDISLPLGRLRIRAKGTDGGHNGIKNVIYQLQSDEFARVKIGVSSNGSIPLINYVLDDFSKKELEVLREIAKININIINDFIKEGAYFAMNKYNSTNLLKEEN